MKADIHSKDKWTINSIVNRIEMIFYKSAIPFPHPKKDNLLFLYRKSDSVKILWFSQPSIDQSANQRVDKVINQPKPNRHSVLVVLPLWRRKQVTAKVKPFTTWGWSSSSELAHRLSLGSLSLTLAWYNNLHYCTLTVGLFLVQHT